MNVVSVFLCPAVLKDATDARNAKHAAVWVNGALYHTDAAGLRSICRHCDEPIRRTSYKSAQWRLATAAERCPEPWKGDCLAGDCEHVNGASASVSVDARIALLCRAHLRLERSLRVVAEAANRVCNALSNGEEPAAEDFNRVQNWAQYTISFPSLPDEPMAATMPTGVAAVVQSHHDFAAFRSETGTTTEAAIPAARPRNSGQQNGADPLGEFSAPPANPEPQSEDSTFAGDTP